MSTKGRGMSTGYRLGDNNCLCDRCQRKFWASDLQEEWTGWMVCDSCFEERHPQEYLRGHADDPSVEVNRPDREDATLEYNDDISKVLIASSNIEVQNWSTGLSVDRVVELSTTNAQKGDRFLIYKSVDDGSTLYITTTTLDSGTSV